LVFPLLQGGKRRANKNSAALYLQRNKQDLIQLENRVNSGYALALAVYKVNMQNYLSLKENLLLAREVYDVIQLQYRSGIKTYLEVITAEADLRSTQINYFTAMYQLLASKIDVQKSLGQINY
jgi:outer membrane protein TolC